MKKVLAVIIAVIAVGLTLVLVKNFSASEKVETDYLRIHVRANSNSQTDQNIKYIVKDEVVKFITPYAAQCTDKERAMEIISLIPLYIHAESLRARGRISDKGLRRPDA